MKYTLTFLFVVIATHLFAIDGNHTPLMVVDQFGYKEISKKICVISSPQAGYDLTPLAANYTPGATLQLKRTSDNSVVFSAAPVSWNGGNTHNHSGNKIWHFDFSAYTTQGSYYIYDQTNNTRTYPFTIHNQVYDTIFIKAQRFYYHQRCGVAKTAANAGNNYADAICHSGANQDLHCRAAWDVNNAALEKNMSGGWHDAGDYNKYVTYASRALEYLLTAYEQNPLVFGDNNNIPESGNGIPDIIDEIKWELDWLLKMQENAAGAKQGAVYYKTSVQCFENTVSPPSADGNVRVYGDISQSATRCIAKTMAHACLVMKKIPNVNAYADNLITSYAPNLLSKAELAWTWLTANPNPSLYNNSGFGAGNGTCGPGATATAIDEDYDAPWQSPAFYMQVTEKTLASVYLYAATNNPVYRSFFDATYGSTHPMLWYFWSPHEQRTQDVLLYYTSLPVPECPAGVLPTAAVVNDIKNVATAGVYSNTGSPYSYTNLYNGGSGNPVPNNPYFAYLQEADYTFNSNEPMCNFGNLYAGTKFHNADPAHNIEYENSLAHFAHYIHGVNPTNWAWVSNAAGLGAENSLPEIYHGWFKHGSAWDWDTDDDYTGDQLPYKGPPPMFVPTGVCKDLINGNGGDGVPASFPLYLQFGGNDPVMKKYRLYNNPNYLSSFKMNEVGLYVQGAYIRLLSNLVTTNTPVIVLPVKYIALQATLNTENDIALQWRTFSEQNCRQYHVQQSTDSKHFTTIATTASQAPNGNSASELIYFALDKTQRSGQLFYRIQQEDFDGNSSYSNVVDLIKNEAAIIKLYPNPVNDKLDVHFYYQTASPLVITVSDLNGRSVLSQQAMITKGNFTCTLNLQPLPAGIYHLKITEKGKLVFHEKIHKN
ncbi:MAG: glycoside hydrolase family 9 protein [Chitinophagaceae bacterium]|nr:glycoside hydrolase family 9 protein [Chitinophagaceae bacterium]